MMSRSTMPVSRTTELNARPTSLSNVMSPNPRVLITVRVQYTPVNHEWSCPSLAMITWKSQP